MKIKPKFLSLTLLLSLLLPGCGKRAYILAPGTTIVNQKEVQTEAIVPDKDGNMVPGVRVTIPEGAPITVPEKDITTRR